MDENVTQVRKTPGNRNLLFMVLGHIIQHLQVYEELGSSWLYLRSGLRFSYPADLCDLHPNCCLPRMKSHAKGVYSWVGSIHDPTNLEQHNIFGILSHPYLRTTAENWNNYPVVSTGILLTFHGIVAVTISNRHLRRLRTVMEKKAFDKTSSYYIVLHFSAEILNVVCDIIIILQPTSRNTVFIAVQNMAIAEWMFMVDKDWTYKGGKVK